MDRDGRVDLLGAGASGCWKKSSAFCSCVFVFWICSIGSWGKSLVFFGVLATSLFTWFEILFNFGETSAPSGNPWPLFSGIMPIYPRPSTCAAPKDFLDLKLRPSEIVTDLLSGLFIRFELDLRTTDPEFLPLFFWATSASAWSSGCWYIFPRATTRRWRYISERLSLSRVKGSLILFLLKSSWYLFLTYLMMLSSF